MPSLGDTAEPGLPRRHGRNKDRRALVRHWITLHKTTTMAAAMQQCAAGIERVTSGRAVGLGRKNQMMKGTAVPSRVVGHPGGQRRRRTVGLRNNI